MKWDVKGQNYKDFAIKTYHSEDMVVLMQGRSYVEAMEAVASSLFSCYNYIHNYNWLTAKPLIFKPLPLKHFFLSYG